jgi:hypothetical protein
MSFIRSAVVMLSVVVAVPLYAGIAAAADLPLPPPKQLQPKAEPKMQPSEFDRLGGDCMEATNGCQRFVRAADGKFDAANNIGIACQPQPLSCTKRR